MLLSLTKNPVVVTIIIIRFPPPPILWMFKLTSRKSNEPGITWRSFYLIKANKSSEVLEMEVNLVHVVSPHFFLFRFPFHSKRRRLMMANVSTLPKTFLNSLFNKKLTLPIQGKKMCP